MRRTDRNTGASLSGVWGQAPRHTCPSTSGVPRRSRITAGRPPPSKAAATCSHCKYAHGGHERGESVYGRARVVPTPSWSVFDFRSRTCRPSCRCRVMSPIASPASSERRNAPANPINNTALSRRSYTWAAHPVAVWRAAATIATTSSANNGARAWAGGPRPRRRYGGSRQRRRDHLRRPRRRVPGGAVPVPDRRDPPRQRRRRIRPSTGLIPEFGGLREIRSHHQWIRRQHPMPLGDAPALEPAPIRHVRPPGVLRLRHTHRPADQRSGFGRQHHRRTRGATHRYRRRTGTSTAIGVTPHHSRRLKGPTDIRAVPFVGPAGRAWGFCFSTGLRSSEADGQKKWTPQCEVHFRDSYVRGGRPKPASPATRGTECTFPACRSPSPPMKPRSVSC